MSEAQQGEQDSASARPSASPPGPVGDFPCPNCSKVFRREDLLRRHLAREARAQTQPSLDRQKSCFECARSKARCDLEVPACGRCRKKGKPCTYAPRSGNPNVRKARQSGMSTTWQDPALSYIGRSDIQSFAAVSSTSHIQQSGIRTADGSYDSDDSRLSTRSSQSRYDMGRTLSQSSGSTNGATNDPSNQMHPYNTMHSTMPSPAFHPAMPPPQRTESPTPFQHAPAPPQPQAPFGKRGASIITSLDRGGRAYEMEDGEETPISRMVSSFTQRDGMDFAMQVDESVPRGDTVVPVEPSAASIAKLTLDSRQTDPPPPTPRGGSASHRSLPPLLTGVRMPGVGSAMLRTALQVPNALDLSGWLDEPVVPSPLYRLGPYSALKTAGPFSFALPGMDMPQTGTAEPLPGAEASASDQDLPAETAPPKLSNQGAARHIWEHGIRGSEDLPETLARAAAAHLITYPTLMVLPEATSPVPPFIFRSWLASVRSDLPASLAVARVVLAGYIVRLPSSQDIVWESIAREMRILTRNVESAIAADDLSIFATTAALWLYLVLAILTEEPAVSVFVDDSLVNAGLQSLSQLASSLSMRIKVSEAEVNTNDAAGSMGFSRWGLVETMRRTLFAAYTILVLQRFREGALEIQQRLAGCNLVLDVALPASARVFEAANEAEWRARQEEERSQLGNGTKTRLTLRDLTIARRGAGQVPANLASFFDRHDEFTNVCLSVALGLDSDAM
ncbi:hypothetical protein K437DRAFT_136991 [Tilletiaria anomala UBC 951]|uniref:Zn(2)-C6 fungal-type domain-containing protein n=1 Tax=Tilletiaria anomala (strain ATCC 24038 / CBS 436.72 / UBC 951) TaxID=1037660 RepID=A0A066W1A1_TILAU|nr:uncharacterized protein K437DRAFT_136991 [Tilletiaria anomala UBC 951]KDN44575.1 hypothetical protein K437DRAFT_136991 [Tilletiaria anomala UBC 951]